MPSGSNQSFQSPEKWECPEWRQKAMWTTAFLGMICLLFGDLLSVFVERWSQEPQYSHGFAIPLIAVGLGYFLFPRVKPGRVEIGEWGFTLLFVGCVLHIMAVYVFVEFADCLALLFCIAGGFLLIWGSKLFRGLWPAVLFLVFMFPLPFTVERMLSAPLQIYGAKQSAWYIQLMGIPAVARGSLIMMGEHKLGVAEACSGMRMLTVFFAICTATIIVSNRTAWERCVLFFAAIPIALICNIGRIVATALAHHYLGQETADLVFHDLSGWLMMPSAMLLLYVLLKMLDWVLIDRLENDKSVSSSNSPGPFPGLPTVARS